MLRLVVQNRSNMLLSKTFLLRTLLFLGSCTALQAAPGPLREKLAHKIPDIERIDTIISAYNDLKDEVPLKQKSTKAIEKWLTNKAYFVGSRFYDHNLLFDKLPKLKKNKQFKAAYKEFISKITYYNNPTDTDKKITILFTGAYGGGHKAPTMAIKAYLEHKGYTIQLIDVDERENRYSPEVDGYTKADLYAEVYQKLNDPAKAKELGRKLSKAQPIEDRRFLGDIREEVAEFGPKHILAVAHHKPRLAYISYVLGCPMTYIHTDHGFRPMLQSILTEQKRLKKPLIRFGLIGDDKLFKAKKEKKRQVVRVDFPVRASFKPISPSRLKSLRKRMQIEDNAYVVKVAMGQNGLAKDIKKILVRMIEEEKKLKNPLYVYVVCGRNEQLQEQLAPFANAKGKIHIKILGFLEEKEMAKIDRASDVWITKPGGSTSAELVETQKQMLYEINASHGWEKSNAAQLKKLGLAKKMSKKRSIIKQIQERINRHKKINKKKLPRSQWQAQIDKIVS